MILGPPLPPTTSFSFPNSESLDPSVLRNTIVGDIDDKGCDLKETVC